MYYAVNNSKNLVIIVFISYIGYIMRIDKQIFRVANSLSDTVFISLELENSYIFPRSKFSNDIYITSVKAIKWREKTHSHYNNDSSYDDSSNDGFKNSVDELS